MKKTFYISAILLVAQAIIISCQTQEANPEKKADEKSQMLNSLSVPGKVWRVESVSLETDQDSVDITNTDPTIIIWKEVMENDFFEFTSYPLQPPLEGGGILIYFGKPTTPDPGYPDSAKWFILAKISTPIPTYEYHWDEAKKTIVFTHRIPWYFPELINEEVYVDPNMPPKLTSFPLDYAADKMRVIARGKNSAGQNVKYNFILRAGWYYRLGSEFKLVLL